MLVSVILIAYAYHIRVDGIFACEASGYHSDHFLAYCNADSYRNYDQGSFWFQLEPDAIRNTREAQVLLVGNSKLQFALSTEETLKWFAKQSTKFFLFGFAESETVSFFDPVIQSLQPHARAVVIHIDNIFEDRETLSMQVIKQESNAKAIYRMKKLWQSAHRNVCGRLPAICGQEPAQYRSRENGTWILTGRPPTRPPQPVTDGVPVDRDTWADQIERADRFISLFPVERECVLLTLVPSTSTQRERAEAIADALNMPLISPSLEGLQTFDLSHLDRPSATRWSEAFLEVAGPRLRQCLDTNEVSTH